MLKISKLFSIAATAFIVSGQALFAGNIPESDDPIKVTIQELDRELEMLNHFRVFPGKEPKLLKVSLLGAISIHFLAGS